MRARLRLALLLGIVLVPSLVSQAWAGSRVWWVPGVINNGLATVVSCTNGGSGPASVTVDMFHQTTGASGTGNASIPAGQSHSFASQPVASLPGATNLGSADIRGGSARITAASGVFCAAFVISTGGDPPTVFSTLPVIKKNRQKGQ
jgi:hypothetical protein